MLTGIVFIALAANLGVVLHFTHPIEFDEEFK
jgi:hypothetical protein